MSDPLRGKYTGKRYFAREFQAAKERLAPLGGEVIPGVHDYEAFIYNSKNLKLIFYPHKTSAGNHHIRVRPAGNPDKKLLREAIFALAENTCTFQCPSLRAVHQDAVYHSLDIGRKLVG